MSDESSVAVLNVFELNFPEFELICDRCGRKSTADGKLKIFAPKVFVENRKSRQHICKTSRRRLRLAFEMANTSDQLFTQQHRSAFPSKIEIYEMKQRKSFNAQFSFYRLNLEAGNVLTFIRRLLRLGMRSRRKVEAFERQPNE